MLIAQQIDSQWWVIDQDSLAKVAGPFGSEDEALSHIPPIIQPATFAINEPQSPAPTAKLSGSPTLPPSSIAAQSPPSTDRRHEGFIARNAAFMVSISIVVMFLSMLLVMAFHTSPSDNKDMLNTLLGILGGAFTLVLNYWFGTNASSSKKDYTIAQLSK